MADIKIRLVTPEMKNDLKAIAKSTGISQNAWIKMRLKEAIYIEKNRK